MAIYFVPPQQDSGLSQTLGGLAGAGLGLLGGYASKQYSMPQKIKKFEAFGANPEQAKALANSSEAQQTAWLREAMKEQARQKQAQQFSNLISGGQQPPVQQPMQPQAPQSGMEAMSALGGPAQQAQVPQPGQEPRDVGKLLGGRAIEELQEYRDKVLRSGGDPKMVQDAVAILDRQISEKIKIKSTEQKENLAERKFEHQKEKEAAKESKEYYDTFKVKARDARENNMRYGSQKRLIKEGKLVGPGAYQVMQKMGIPLDPASAEYDKLINDSVKGIKSVFGARITDFDIVSYMKTLAGLGTTRAGKEAIINNNEIVNEGIEVINKAIKEVIKKNGGKRPADLEEQVEDMTRRNLDKLSEEYMSGIRNVNIEPETWSEWAGRVLPGPVSSAVSTVAKAVPGAVIGARLGGPWGAAAGGLLGAGGLGSILKGLGGE